MFRYSLIKLIVTTKDFGIWMTCYRQKFTLWPGNWIFSEKKLKWSKIWTTSRIFLLWRVLDAKLYTPGQLLKTVQMGYMQGRWHRNWGDKEINQKANFFEERSSPKNFQGKFFRGRYARNPYALTIPNMFAKGISRTSLSALPTSEVRWCLVRFPNQLADSRLDDAGKTRSLNKNKAPYRSLPQ